MKWEATDQFGNLYVGVSNSADATSLVPEVDDLLSKLRERCGDAFQVTVDGDYGEINGPDPDSVAYVLQVAWLTPENSSEVVALISNRAQAVGLDSVMVSA